MLRHATVYRFGPFELRVRTRELYKHQTKLKLRPQPFRVLALLAERAGDVVTREELRHSLWSAETFVDFEHSLNTSIKELRGVLSDSASEPRYIETLPKLGYRIIVPVDADRDVPSTEPATPLLTPPPEQATKEEIILDRLPRSSPYVRPTVLVGLALLVFSALGAYFSFSHSHPRPQPNGGRSMLAVLPFQNLTGDAGQDYFSDLA